MIVLHTMNHFIDLSLCLSIHTGQKGGKGTIEKSLTSCLRESRVWNWYSRSLLINLYKTCAKYKWNVTWRSLCCSSHKLLTCQMITSWWPRFYTTHFSVLCRNRRTLHIRWLWCGRLGTTCSWRRSCDIMWESHDLPSLVEVDEENEVISKDCDAVGRWHDDYECKHIIDECIEGLREMRAH